MQNIQLSFDILDYIFSFLVSDRETLTACSKDPVLSSLVERHVYYHIIVQFGIRTTDSDSSTVFEPNHLSKFVSENPHILCYVRILQIQIDLEKPEEMDNSFASTLLMFRGLECIMLTASKVDGWGFPGSFRAALEDRLNLPTVKEVHLTGNRIPLSLLNNSKNIKNLSLSGFSDEDRFYTLTLPQLHSLRLLTRYISSSLLSWLKLHTKELRSLRCALSRWNDLSELLRVCSGTLQKLDFDLGYSPYILVNLFRKGLLDSTPVLPYLGQLTIRTIENQKDQSWTYHTSLLPAVAHTVNIFSSSLHHLTIDIKIALSKASDLTLVNFSPLAILGAASRSIPRIDLYVHTGVLLSPVTLAHILSSLEVYEDIARSIKEGVLVIHSEKAAPDCLQGS